MYALIRLFWPAFTTTTITPKLADRSETIFAFEASMLDESFFSADGNDEPQDNTQAPASVGMYRRWLSLVFDQRGLSPSTSPLSSSVANEGWVVIDQIKKEDKVFEDIWDPSVSGDWSELLVHVPQRQPSGISPVSSSGRSDSPTFDVSRNGSLLRWAFKTDDFDSVQRDFDRIDIWRKTARSLKSTALASYLESVVVEIDESLIHTIANDVARTYPPELHSRMTRLLQAYAARNPAVGFCQGMSYIISTLLQNEWLSDEEAFDIMCAIIEGVNTDYYNDGLTGLHMDLRRLEKFLFYVSRTTLPVPIELVLVEPMICLFTRLVPVASASRMIDIALTHGKVGLFSVYLGLIEILLPSLQAAMDGAESPSMAIVDGAVGFKLAMIDLLTNDCDNLIRRSEAFLLTHRADLERVIAEDISIEKEDRQVELVMSSTTPLPGSTRGNLFSRFRMALASILDSDDSGDETGQ